MHTYNFHERLSPREFEKFAWDLLEVFLKTKLFITPVGPESGIDLYNDNKSIICQVKNYEKFETLFQNLKIELEKVKKLKIKRYILVVSPNLKISEKTKILTLFADYLKEEDLFDRDLINHLLDNPMYNNVERAHLKLWIPNTFVLENVLDEVLNKSIYLKTKFDWLEIEKTSKIFANSKYFAEALSIIESESSIIISGEPGIGKTTLAHAIISYLTNITEKIQFISVTSVEELYTTFDSERNQVFFFDDFWGDIAKNNALTNIEQNKLLDILTHIKNANNKWIVLTTREYIFNQVIQENNKLADKYKIKKFLLELNQDDSELKFDILYNHLKKSQFSYEEAQAMLNKYEVIINHRNYSPRILEIFFNYCDKNRNEINYQTIANKFSEYLEAPYDFFTKIFENQTSHAKLILIILGLLEYSITYLELKEKFYYIIKNVSPNLDSILQNEFDKALEQLERTFTLSNIEEDVVYLSLKNPSFKDFILNYLSKHLDEYGDILVNNIDGFRENINLLEIINNQTLTKSREVLQHKIEDNIITYLDKNEFNPNTTKLREITTLLNSINFKTNIHLYDYILKFHNTTFNSDPEFYLVEYDDYYFFPSYFKKVCNFVDVGDPLNLIYNYYFAIGEYDSCVDLIDSLHDLKAIFPDEFKSFFDAQRKEIRQMLVWEIDLFIERFDPEENEADLHLESFSMSIRDVFEKYGFRYTAKLSESLENLSSFIDYDSKEVSDDFKKWEEEYEQSRKKEKETKAYINEKIETFIGKNEVLDYETMRSCFEKSGLPDTLILATMKKISRLDYAYKNVVHNQNSLNILIDYLKIKKKLPTHIFDIFENYLKDYDSKLITSLASFAATLLKLKKASYTEDDLQEALYVNTLENDHELSQLISDKILVKSGNWYQFVHPFLHMYLVYKTNFYYIFPSCFESFVDMWEKQNKIIYNGGHLDIYKLMKSYDVDKWNEFVMKPLYTEFMELVDNDSKISVVKSIIEIFDLEYILSDNYSSITSCKWMHAVDFIYLNIGVDIIFDLFGTENLYDFFAEVLFEYIEIENNDYKLNLSEHISDQNFINILEENGIINHVYEIYLKICDDYKKILSTSASAPLHS